MSLDEFNFVNYDKITSQSDAFITSDELNCYVQYVPSSKALSYKIKKEQHTAGTTNDVNDYKLPDISRQLNPKKLYRINPFHKNNSEFLELNKITTDEEIIFPTFLSEYKEKKKDYSNSGLNAEQIEFLEALEALRRNEFNTKDTRLNIDEFCPVDKRMHDGYFEINARFSEITTTGISQPQFTQEPVETFSSGEDVALNEQLKKFGYTNDIVSLKKKFKVRTGNAKDNPQLNNYLQNKIENKIKNDTIKISNTNLISSDFSSSINLNNQFTNIKVNKLSSLNEQTIKNNLNISNYSSSSESNVNIKFENNIKLSTSERDNFSDAYRKMLKGLSLSRKSNDIYINYVSNLSKNYDYNNNNILNLTEKTLNNLNIVSYSTYNKFYTEFMNKYSQLLTNVNIQNNNLESLTQFVYNNRNNITNIKRFNNTYRTTEFKSTINLFKTEKKVVNEEDYFFKQAVLKTFNISNQMTKIKIDQVKDQINYVKNKISFVNHDIIKIKNFNKEYRINEFKKIINQSDVNFDISNLMVNKLGDRSTVNLVRSTINLLQENKSLLKISNFENLSSITKLSNVNISKFENLVQSVISQPTNVKSINNILNNTNNIKNLSSVLTSKNIENLEKLNLTQNTVNNINKISKFKNVSLYQNSKVSNFNEEINFEDYNTLNKTDIASLSKIDIQAVKILNQAKIENLKAINNFSILNNQEVTKSDLDVISQIKQIKNIEQTIKNINLFESKNTIIQKLSKNIDETKFVELHNWQKVENLVNVFKDKKIFNSINKISNITNVDKVNEVYQSINSLSKISKVLSTDRNTINNISKIINNQDILSLSEIKVSKNSVNNILEVSKSLNNNYSKISKVSKVDNKTLNNIISLTEQKNTINNFATKITNISEKIKIRESLESLNLNTSIIKSTYNTVQKISKNTQNIIKSDILSNINIIDLHKTTKSFSSMNFDYSKKNITNLYNDLNITNVSKIEKSQDKLYSSLIKNVQVNSKNIQNNIRELNFSNKLNNILFKQEINEKISQIKNVQNAFDAKIFNKIEVATKSSKKEKMQNLLEIYNAINTSSKYSTQYKIDNSQFNKVETRIVNKLSKISYDIKKTENLEDVRVLNIKKIQNFNYFEEQEQKRKQEEMISEHVEKLLVDKIQNVTNNIVHQVVTKQEINQIKNEIIFEIFNIENKTEQKLSEFKKETRQTVQNMLEKFLRS